MDALMLSRIQFAFTVGYHFLFVPISIGLALMVVYTRATRYYKSRIPATRQPPASGSSSSPPRSPSASPPASPWSSPSAPTGRTTRVSSATSSARRWPPRASSPSSLSPRSWASCSSAARGSRRACTTSPPGSSSSAPTSRRCGSSSPTPGSRHPPATRSSATVPCSPISGPRPSIRRRRRATCTRWPAALIAGCFVVASISAWYLLKKRHLHMARQSLVAALVIGLLASAAMPFIGHWHALVVAEYQPVKMAAFENVDRDPDERPALRVRLGRTATGTTTGLAIPSGLSLMLGLSPDHEVKGLDIVPRRRPAAGADHLPELPPHDRPLVPLHRRDAAGARPARRSRQLENARWMLWLLVVVLPAAHPRHQHGLDRHRGRSPAVDRPGTPADLATASRRSVSSRRGVDTTRHLRPDLPDPVHRLAAHLPRHHPQGAGRRGRDAATSEKAAGPAAPAGAGR